MTFTFTSSDELEITAYEWSATDTKRCTSSAVVERYTSHLDHVSVHIYPGAGHEVFNETNRDEVVADPIDWLGGIVAVE